MSRILAISTALILLSTAGLLAANALLKKAPPAPLWTESDLPPLPSAAKNGWVLVQHEAGRGSLPKLSSVLATLTQVTPSRDAATAWGDVQTQRPAIEDFVGAPDNSRWYAALAVARTKAEYADACPLKIDATCSHIAVLRVHQLQELQALRLALAGRWNDAFDATTALARMDVAYNASTRTIVATMVGLRCGARLVDLADVLISGYAGAESGRESLEPSTGEGLIDALGGLSEDEIDLRRAVIAEYRFALDTLELAERSPEAVTGGTGAPDLGPMGRLLLDKGETISMINDDYKPLAEFARAPGGPIPPPPPQRATGSTWWMHNAVGKTLLDLGGVQLGSLLKKAGEERTALLARRDEVSRKARSQLLPQQ